MAPTIVLISGASRGLGKYLLSIYLSRPNHIVIAANRDPSHATSKALADLSIGSGSRLIVVKTDATVESDPAKAVDELIAQGIDHLDLVIANAGLAQVYPKVSELKIADLLIHLAPNVFGMVWLYQATLPLLHKATNPKWVTMGSSAGSLEDTANPNFRNQPPVPNAAYGPSKAAVHWLTKRIDAEEPQLTAFPVHPGWVRTDGGNSSARAFGLEQAPQMVEECCNELVKLIDVATKETHGGKFWQYDGVKLAW